MFFVVGMVEVRECQVRTYEIATMGREPLVGMFVMAPLRI